MASAKRGYSRATLRRGLVVAGAVAWLVITSGGAGAQTAPATQNLPLLSHASEIRRLTPDQATLGFPVRIQAVVAYYDTSQGDFFVIDSTGGIYADDGSTDLHLRSGQRIEIEGFTGPGGYAPIIIQPRVEVLGSAPLPRAIRVTFADLISGKEDSQWVEIEGVVQSAVPNAGRVELEISTGAGRLSAFIPAPLGEQFLRLVDARVRLRGVSASLV
ncbi:MAG: hypothetical protein ABSG54_14200, partial [Terriglobia bacterium]